MKIYFATWVVEKSQGITLTKKKVKSRLLSYHLLKEQNITNPLFEEYIETGECDPRKNKT